MKIKFKGYAKILAMFGICTLCTIPAIVAVSCSNSGDEGSGSQQTPPSTPNPNPDNPGNPGDGGNKPVDPKPEPDNPDGNKPVQKEKIDIKTIKNPDPSTLDFSGAREAYYNSSHERPVEYMKQMGLFSVGAANFMSAISISSTNVNEEKNLMIFNSKYKKSKLEYVNLFSITTKEFDVLKKHNLISTSKFRILKNKEIIPMPNTSFSPKEIVNMYESFFKPDGSFSIEDSIPAHIGTGVRIVSLANDSSIYYSVNDIFFLPIWIQKENGENRKATVFDFVNEMFSSNFFSELTKNPEDYKEIFIYEKYTYLFVYNNIFNYFQVDPKDQEKVRLEFRPVSRCDANMDTTGVNKYNGNKVLTEIDLVVRDEYKDKYELSEHEPLRHAFDLKTLKREYKVIKGAYFEKSVYSIEYVMPPFWSSINWESIYNGVMKVETNHKVQKEISERVIYKYIINFAQIIKKYVNQEQYYTAILNEELSADSWRLTDMVNYPSGVSLNNSFILETVLPYNDYFYLKSNYNPLKTQSSNSNNLNKNEITTKSINNKVNYQVHKTRMYESWDEEYQIASNSINIFSDHNYDYNGYENDLSYFENVEKYYKYIWSGRTDFDKFKLSDTFNDVTDTNLDLYLINWFPVLNSRMVLNKEDNLKFNSFNSGVVTAELSISSYPMYNGFYEGASLLPETWGGEIVGYDSSRYGKYYTKLFGNEDYIISTGYNFNFDGADYGLFADSYNIVKENYKKIHP